MTQSRVRLSHTELAALARYAFGLSPEAPDLPPAAEYEDAEGVLVATAADGGLAVREIPRWRSPASVRQDLAARGWDRPPTAGGQPPPPGGGTGPPRRSASRRRTPPAYPTGCWSCCRWPAPHRTRRSSRWGPRSGPTSRSVVSWSSCRCR